MCIHFFKLDGKRIDMHYRLSVTIFLCLLVFTLFGQGYTCKYDLIPKQQDGKQFGYVTLWGEWQITPMFDKARPFYENIAVVMRHSKYCAINCEGSLVLPCEYDEIKPFSGGVSWVQKNKLWGLVNNEGEVMLSPEFSEVNRVSRYNDYAWLKKDTVWGLFDEGTQEFIFEPQFTKYKEVSEHISIVEVEGKSGFIDHQEGSFLVEPTLEKVKKVAPYRMSYKVNGKWGLISDQGHQYTEAVYDTILPYYKFSLKVKKGDQYGMMGYDGKLLTPVKLDALFPVKEGAARYRKDGKYGFLTVSGTRAIPAKYDTAGDFRDHQAIVSHKGRYGIINRKDSFLIQPEYRHIERGEDQYYYRLQQEDGHFLLAERDLQLTEEIFQNVALHEDVKRILVTLKNGKKGFYHLKARTLHRDKMYDDAFSFKDNFALVVDDGRWGVIDKSMKPVIPLAYDSIKYEYTPRALYFQLFNEGKTGFAHHSGRIDAEPDMQEIVFCAADRIKFKKEDEWGIMDYRAHEKLSPEYDEMSHHKKDTLPDWPAVVYNGRRYGMCDSDGEEILRTRYDEVRYLGHQWYGALKRGDWEVYNAEGKQVFEETFKELGVYDGRFIPVLKKDTWGYVDQRGKTMIDFQFEAADAFINDLAVVKKNGKWGVINKAGHWVEKPAFTSYDHTNGKRILSDENQQVNVKTLLNP